METLCLPPPHLTLCISPIWQFLSCSFYNKTAIVMLSWVLWVILVNSRNWRGFVRTSQFIHWSDVWVVSETCNWYLKWRQPCETEPLVCGASAHAKWLVSKLNWIVGHPGVVGEFLWLALHTGSSSPPPKIIPLSLLWFCSLQTFDGNLVSQIDFSIGRWNWLIHRRLAIIFLSEE